MRTILLLIALGFSYQLFGQETTLSREDSIDLFFRLRNDLEVVYDSSRTSASEDFSMQMAKEYRDAWFYVNYKLKAWKLNRNFTFEWYQMQRALTLVQVKEWALMIEFVKVPDWR